MEHFVMVWNFWNISYILENNLILAISVVIVLALRFFLQKKVSRKLWLYLWWMVLLQALVPLRVTVSSRWMNGEEEIGQAGVSTNLDTVMPGEGDQTKDDHTDTVSIKQNQFSATDALNRLVMAYKTVSQTIWQKMQSASENRLFFWIWCVPGVILLGSFLLLYLVFLQKLSFSQPYENETLTAWKNTHHLRRKITIRCSDEIGSPLSYGVIHPVILFPYRVDYEAEDLVLILEHEYVHVRRMDILLKELLCLLVSVFWFNPFSWLMLFCCNRDMELSCDEQVVETIGWSHRKTYAAMLIRQLEAGKEAAPVSAALLGDPMKERLMALMVMKRHHAKGVIVLGCAAFLFISVGLVSCMVPNGIKTSGENDSAAILINKDDQEEKEENEETSIPDVDKKAQALFLANQWKELEFITYGEMLDQIQAEGFSYEEAVYAADHCGVDWVEKAVFMLERYVSKNKARKAVITWSEIRQVLVRMYRFTESQARQAEFRYHRIGTES